MSRPSTSCAHVGGHARPRPAARPPAPRCARPGWPGRQFCRAGERGDEPRLQPCRREPHRDVRAGPRRCAEAVGVVRVAGASITPRVAAGTAEQVGHQRERARAEVAHGQARQPVAQRGLGRAHDVGQAQPRAVEQRRHRCRPPPRASRAPAPRRRACRRSARRAGRRAPARRPRLRAAASRCRRRDHRQADRQRRGRRSPAPARARSRSPPARPAATRPGAGRRARR